MKNRINLPESIEYEIIVDYGMLDPSYVKEKTRFNRKIIQKNNIWKISYGKKVTTEGSNLDDAISKMKKLLKAFNPNITEEEYKKVKEYESRNYYSDSDPYGK
jgi:hypothetical protein